MHVLVVSGGEGQVSLDIFDVCHLVLLRVELFQKVIS